MVVVFRFRGLVALAMIVSGSLVQVKGAQRSFQAAMKRSIAAMRSATVGKLPRCRAGRVMIEKNASTRFSQEPEVGVKCRCTRGYPRVAGEPGADRGMVVGGVVVDHHVQFPAGVGGGDLAQKGADLLVPVPFGAGVGDPAGGHLECGEQRGGAVPAVVEAGPLRRAGPAGEHRGGAVRV